MRSQPILVTGSTGYVGGRLVPQLLSSGLLYWYIFYPFHQWVFLGMLKGIANAVGKPVIQGPDRFAPRRHHVCHVNPRAS